MPLPIHPAADVWPMLTQQELDDLAASIQQIGLLEPIVKWPNPETGEFFLLDGRNRLAACDLVGVEPDVVVYEGDPVAYVLARNEQRRHMTKGQRAMAAWMTASVSDNRTTIRYLANATDAGRDNVGMAKIVAEYAPDLVPNVIGGATPLKDAYVAARSRRDAANSDDNLLERLRAEHPDLATQVVEETLTLTEALAAGGQRDADRRERITRKSGYLRTVAEGWRHAVTFASTGDDPEFSEALEALSQHDQVQVAEALAAATHE